MKKLSFFLMAMILCFAPALRAADVTETIAMKKFGGLSTGSYENVTKTGTSDRGTEMVAYAFNPTTGQVRGNKTTIAGASITSKDDSKNWSLYNTQAMPGAIKKITVTQTATGTNKFQNNLFVALGTTNQGAVTTVTGAQKNTTGTATEFTFEIDETQGYTYFKLLSNVKFTSGSVAGVVVTVTYAEAASNPDAVKYTVTANVNDPAMGTVSGAGEYEEGKTATLTANANAGYRFVNWSNGSTDNPLKITVTEDVEITANFEVIPPMTCAEAAAAASGATVVLNPFDVVYVVKDAGYIYIKDESGVNLIYDYNLAKELKAGDHVEGFVGVSSPYSGLPELKPSVAFADLTVTPGTAPEPTLFTVAPVKADVNKYVKFENVTFTANVTYTAGSTGSNATMVVNGKNVTLRNTFKLAATLSKDKAYNVVGFVAIYNSTIQVYFLSATEYVEPCTLATPVNWDEKIAVEANSDKWYLMDLTSAIEARQDLVFNLVNNSADSVVVTVEAHDACPTDEFTLIQSSTQTVEPNASKAKVIDYLSYLEGQVEEMYIHVITKGGALDLDMETATYTVTATAENGTVAGAGTFEDGDTITLTATPAEGYEFVNWTVADSVVSTENPYTFVLAADIAIVANFKQAAPATETVYFINTKKWSAVKAHAWGGTAAGTTWPGLATTKEAEKIANYDVYSFTAKVGAYKNVIFNNNGAGSQTPDLVWTAGKYYVMDMGWMTKEDAEAKLATPLPETWNIVGDAGLMGKGWDLNAAENAMTKQADGTYKLEKKGITITAGTYEYKAAKDHDWAVAVPQDGNQKLTISKSGIYDITFVLDVTAKKLTATATLKQEAVVIPAVIIAGDMNSWNQTKDKFTMSADSLTATFKTTLTAKSYGFKMIVGGAWLSDGKTITRTANSHKFTGANGGNSTLKTDIAGEYLFTWEYATKTLTVTYPALPVKYNVTVTAENGTVTGAGAYEEGKTATLTATPAEGYKFLNWTVGDSIVSTENPYSFVVTADIALVANFEKEPEIEWIPMDLEIANLVTEVMEVEGAKYLRLQGRDDMNDADVMLFLNNYADVDDDYEVNTESSFMTFGGLELTVLEGVMTQTSETDKGTIYTGTVRASVEEEGETMYVEFALTMYAAPATVLVLTDAIVAINEELGTLTFNVPTGDGEGYYAELAGYTAPGVHEGPQICLFMTPEAVAYTNYAETSVADGIITLKGEFVSPMGPKFDVTISGKLPEQEPVVKPEPTYTENNLNPYAFGLESKLSDDKTTLTVTYRLNNSNATSVNVVIYNGTEVVATVPGTTTIGKNIVEVATGNLPGGVELKWAVEVNGTSVAAPTAETKIYSFYHPSGVDIDINPENETFGMLLVNEGMQAVKGETGYVSSGFGAGIFAFTPSFDLIPNGELPGYNGGIEFTTGRADGTGTAYSPRRIRISEDGRIFVTSLNTDGNYLWEVNADNLNEWTPVFKGTLNDNRELITADSAFIAAPNTGFDVKGAGENLQLAMYSVNLPGITGAAMSGFRLHEYNLGTATEWTTAPSKAIVEGKYAINYTGTQVEYDNEGGLWIASYRGTANDANPGLVHINADGVEDAKLVWSNVRQAGIRFNKDFTKLVVAGNNGAAKKATIYTISKDANGAPVLTEEAVIDMANVGNNLNDFAWDYAGNLYSCGNSAEKLAAWAMPYSGKVETPAAAKYAFQLPEPLKMVGTVKRAVQIEDAAIVLTHEADGTAHIYKVVNGVAIAELSQEGVIARDAENAGDLLAISDIAATEDGKLVAVNSMVCQSAEDYVDAGYKRGETRFYIWNELDADPTVWFKSNMYGNWFRSKEGGSMAIKGTSTNAQIMVTSIHATKYWSRFSVYSVIDGVYNEPADAATGNEHYTWCEGPAAGDLDENVLGVQYELNASATAGNWIIDAELANPIEFVQPATIKEVIATLTPLTEDLGKKYQGVSIVTVGEQVLMVAPFATPEGKLTSVEILDITNGLDAAQYVDQLFIDEAVEATAAATAVEVVEGDEATALLITLVADATIYSLEATLAKGDNWEIYEDEITNLVIDLDNLVLIGGPSSAFQVDVYLGLGEYNRNDDTYQLLPESSVALFGTDATFVEGYAYEVDAFTPSAKAVVRCVWNGMNIELHLTMTAEPMEATKVVVENAMVEIEKYLLFGDMYDYALTMSGEWVNPEDGLTYPVLVEVPVYYPEATEPSEIMSTVTVGGWGDNDPWLGFGEGTLTVTTVNDVVTATGIVQNPMAGVAIDITISGKIIPNALENVETTVAPVKVIKNGQLIIIKNGVEYNVQGAVIK